MAMQRCFNLCEEELCFMLFLLSNDLFMFDEKIERVLEDLEKTAGSFWNVPRSTGSFLNIITRAIKAKKVLEVGTSNGYSGIFLAEALSHNQGTLYTVESHKERFALAAANFKKAGLDSHIEQILGHAPEVFVDFAKRREAQEGFDVIFIDATKMEYKSYLEALMPFLKPEGVLVADNCLSHKSELEDFLEFTQKSPFLQSTLLPFDNGLMLCLKTGNG